MSAGVEWRCDECRHWDRDIRGYQAVPDIGQCMKAVELWEATVWDDEGERVLKPEHAGQMSFANDGSGYAASFWTKPQFFCAHYEPANAPPPATEGGR